MEHSSSAPSRVDCELDGHTFVVSLDPANIRNRIFFSPEGYLIERASSPFLFHYCQTDPRMVDKKGGEGIFPLTEERTFISKFF